MRIGHAILVGGGGLCLMYCGGRSLHRGWDDKPLLQCDGLAYHLEA